MKKLILFPILLISFMVYGQVPDTVNVGTGEDTGTGETVRSAFGKVNSNDQWLDQKIDTIKGTVGDSATQTYRIIPQSATPSPLSGLIYFDDDDDILRFYNGSQWDSLNVAGSGGGGGGLTDSTIRTIFSDTVREWSIANGFWADSVLMKDGIVIPLDGKLYLKNSTNSIELDGSGNLQLKDNVNGSITLDEFINAPDTLDDHNNRLLAIEQAFLDSANLEDLVVTRADTFGLTWCKGGRQARDTIWVLDNEIIGSKGGEESDTLILTSMNAVAIDAAGFGSITYDLDIAWHQNLFDGSATHAETSYITCTSTTSGTIYTAWDSYMILPGERLWIVINNATDGAKPTYIEVTLYFYRL